MAGSSSGLYLNGVLSSSSWNSSFRPAKRARTNRSVWNAADDWDELVAASTLSTASVSTRPPRPRGLQTLALCAEHAAVRNFRRLYEEGKIRNQNGAVGKGWWENEWEVVPDHLKLRVRDGVYRQHGNVLKLDMIRDLFIIPPELDYPGHLIEALASATLKVLHPPKNIAPLITSLSIRHCPQMSDAAIASLVDHLPNLERVNLKGCALVAGHTVKAILKRCPKIKGLNLKGTKVAETDLANLLAAYGDQIERFKVDGMIQKPDNVFILYTYPRLTHLCIPGNTMNTEHSSQARARQSGYTIAHPTPRPSRPDAIFDWPYFAKIFPSLTHLYLPGLLVPPKTSINLVPDQLVKLSLGFGGAPVPIHTLTDLLSKQAKTLKSIHIGHLLPDKSAYNDFAKLGEVLEQCTLVEDFRFASDPQKFRDSACDNAMRRYYHLVFSEGLNHTWRSSIKHLHVSIPKGVPSHIFDPEGAGPINRTLEHLSFPSLELSNTESFISGLKNFRCLRDLDLSGTSVSTEEVFEILDSCQMISRIDLTSCRGVGVRLRRSIFQAWEEDRAAKRGEGRPNVVEEESPNRRSKRIKR